MTFIPTSINKEIQHSINQKVAGEATERECASPGLPDVCRQALRREHE